MTFISDPDITDNEDDKKDKLVINGDRGDGIPKHLLPPIIPEHQGKKCLVLDLDQTLICSTFWPLREPDFMIDVGDDCYIMKRPGVDDFLKKMGEIYELVIFTAGTSEYANSVLDKLDTHKVISHRLFRESCCFTNNHIVKDLSQLGRPLSGTIILDDRPESYMFHPKNAVPVSPWFDEDLNDTALTDLIPLLIDLGVAEDVRDVLGRG